jgi:hypothetical protein
MQNVSRSGMQIFSPTLAENKSPFQFDGIGSFSVAAMPFYWDSLMQGQCKGFLNRREA